ARDRIFAGCSSRYSIPKGAPMDLRDDSELHDLLREWTAPEAPASLAKRVMENEKRVLKNHDRWWRVLIFGYLRVPVPVACCLAILMVLAVWRLSNPPSAGCTAATVPVPIDTNAKHFSACALNSSC